ncbi:MAG: DUF1302 domain-containing protein [Stenotrophobium sp.]
MTSLKGSSAGCGRMRGVGLAAAVATGVVLSSTAWAGSYEMMDGTTASYRLTLGYALAMRMKNPDQALINGAVDPFVPTVAPSNPGVSGSQQVVGFGHTGLSNTDNFDDGDRNFKKYSLINNRVSAFGEFGLRHDNYGLILSGSAFYDDVYHHKNANTSLPYGPGSTVNKTGAPNEFTAATRHYDGQRAQLLEAYVYGDWNIGDEGALDLRLGQQLVAWGESLFFSGIALSQGPADATKAFVPGAEVKDILLPVNQVALRYSINDKITLLGQYKLTFKPTQLFAEGDYFSPSDLIGPGATFGYGSANPATLEPNTCTGLLPSPLDQLCGLGAGLGYSTLGAPAYIYVTRNPDILPSKHGQYGIGLKYNLTPNFNVGLYRLRYSDTNPAVVLTMGYPLIANPTQAIYQSLPTTLTGAVNNVLSSLGINAANLTSVPITTQAINQPEPVSYALKYYDGIKLTGMSFSTVVGAVNVAGELLYRQGIDMQVQAHIGGVLSPVYTRGNLGQALVSGIYTVNPGFLVDDVAVVGEAGLVHVTKVDAIQPSFGITPVGNGDSLTADTTSSGFQMLALFGNHNVISGWDLSNQLGYSMMIKGNSAMAGAFGSLTGAGDKRLSVQSTMTYLSNLSFALGYNFFFGNPNARVRGSNTEAGQMSGANSPIIQNGYADRDYATFTIKYDL